MGCIMEPHVMANVLVTSDVTMKMQTFAETKRNGAVAAPLHLGCCNEIG